MNPVETLVSVEIVSMVKTSDGIKSDRLLANLATEFLGIQMEEIRKILLDTIAKKEIIEIEYIINGKSKSFFLPVGTEIRIVK